MKSILTIMLAACLVWLGNAAYAGSATATWTNPTQREDGSALAPSDIASTRVEWGTCNGSAFGTLAGSQSTTSGAATSLTISGLAAGTYCFRAYTVLGNGLQSVASLVVSKVVPESPPKPPVLVTVATTAYVLKPSLLGIIRMAAVKEVRLPLGIACDAALPGLNGYGIAGGYIAQCRSG